MIALVMVLAMLAAMALLAVALVIWVVRKQVLARKHRELIRQHDAGAAPAVVATAVPQLGETLGGAMKTYMIWNGTHLKIGRSNDPERRLRELQSSIAGVTGVPGKLRFLLVLNGDVERELHQGFKSSRIGGEWFECDEEMRTLLNLFFKTHDGLNVDETTKLLMEFLTQHASPKSLLVSPAVAASVEEIRRRFGSVPG